MSGGVRRPRTVPGRNLAPVVGTSAGGKSRGEDGKLAPEVLPVLKGASLEKNLLPWGARKKDRR